MDNYDLRPEPKVKKKPNTWNILTVLVLLGICGAVYYFYSLFVNPYTFLNPFQPQALPTSFRTATGTATNTLPPPTETPESVLLRSPSRTKAPTWTPIPSETPKGAKPVGTATITTTPMPATADITYQASTTVHADSACKWFGVGGKVLDAAGKPIPFQTVQVSGTLGGKAVNDIVLSGHDPLPAYGSSGFEFVLGNAPVDSSQELWIMLFDNTGMPLTNKIYFDTYKDCNKNLVMVVFTKNR
jgi:hypothetical protein